MATQLEIIKPDYEQIDRAVVILQAALKTNYLTALGETLDNLLNKTINVENDAPDPETVQTLQQMYQQVQLSQLTSAQRLALVQLLLFKQQQVDRPQANLQATPETMGVLISLLITTLVSHKSKSLQLVDPAVGTGSLLLTIGQQLKSTFPQLKLAGLDNNQDQLAFAADFAQLLKTELTLSHQDAVTPWLLNESADIVIADLPVGYYPVDSRAENFNLRAKSGHSYAHYLILEQSIKALSPSGWGIFIVPAELFSGQEAPTLLRWLTKNAYLQASLDIPASFFHDGTSTKALIVLQKHGSHAKQAQEVLIAKAPDLNNLGAAQHFLRELQQWTKNNINN